MQHTDIPCMKTQKMKNVVGITLAVEGPKAGQGNISKFIFHHLSLLAASYSFLICMINLDS